METIKQEQKKTLPISVSHMKKWRECEDLTSECRSLIQVLTKKIEILCRECETDSDRVSHIISLSASLKTLNSLLKSLETERSTGGPGKDFFQDSRGTTYVSVRHCDLERFSAK
jgi:hypothetical protein